jgi:hypothetical protein
MLEIGGLVKRAVRVIKRRLPEGLGAPKTYFPAPLPDDSRVG